MIKMVISDLFGSARERLRDARGLLKLFGIYLALLLSLAAFVVTSVATIKMVLITLVTLVLAPALFFLLLAFCLTPNGRNRAGEFGAAVLRSWWRLAAVSLPLLLLAVIAFRLLGRFEGAVATPGGAVSVLFTFVRVALFGIAAPLTLIQLWIAAAVGALPKNWAAARALLAAAFGPRPVLTYIAGVLISGALAYLLFKARIPFQQQTAQVVSLLLRTAFGLVIIFFGWIVTLTAMRKASAAGLPSLQN